VRDNIAAFGGDVTRMTLLGHSAGAESSDYFGFAYPNDPIVKGIILTSGTAFTPTGSMDYSGSNFSYVAGQVGCGNLSASSELSCMRNVPIATLENALASDGTSRTTRLKFEPLPDNITYFSNYTARGLAGMFANLVSHCCGEYKLTTGLTLNLTAIIGTNRDEGESLTDSSASAIAPNQTEAEYVTLGGMLCPSVQTAQ
jgi:acetylcholinesterase